MTDLQKRGVQTFGAGTIASRVALRIPEGTAFDDWEQILERILALSESSAWWIGDALAYGEWRYGEKYRGVLEQLELAYDRARDYAYVAGNVPIAVRRPELSWMHHRAVAKLVPVDQEQWLARAAAEEWSYRQLRDAIGAGESAERSAVLEQVRFTVDPGRLERWKAAAARVDASVADWAIAVLDVAAAE